MTQSGELNRSIGLTHLVFYGLGTMVGGGFYALIGRVAGLAGPGAPLALGLSGILALLSAGSFAELSSRFPVSAGEVHYVERGFQMRPLSIVAGWLVILTGVVSAATLSVATVGFLQDFVTVSDTIGVLVLVAAMGSVAAWGIGESVAVVFVITVVEIGALVYVGVSASDALLSLPERWPELVPTMGPASWVGVSSGMFLAFYAFIGFEDLVNLAEEVERPRRNLPIALLAGVVITTLLYVWVSLVAVLTVTPGELAASNTPVARIVSSQGAGVVTTLGVVSMLAGVNGALVQIIMAARVVYGMAKQDQVPRWLGRVHPRTRTPLVATAIMTGVIALLALFFPLTTHARATSAIILVVFTLVNLALWRVKHADPDPDGPGFRLPRPWPLVAALACVAVIAFQLWMLL